MHKHANHTKTKKPLTTTRMDQVRIARLVQIPARERMFPIRIRIAIYATGATKQKNVSFCSKGYNSTAMWALIRQYMVSWSQKVLQICNLLMYMMIEIKTIEGG